MTTYSPDQTVAWTADDMAALEGRTVTVTIDGCPYAQSQRVEQAVLSSSPYGPDKLIGRLQFAGGGGLTWVRDNPGATITVHDEAER